MFQHSTILFLEIKGVLHEIWAQELVCNFRTMLVKNLKFGAKHRRSI